MRGKKNKLKSNNKESWQSLWKRQENVQRKNKSKQIQKAKQIQILQKKQSEAALPIPASKPLSRIGKSSRPPIYNIFDTSSRSNSHIDIDSNSRRGQSNLSLLEIMQLPKTHRPMTVVSSDKYTTHRDFSFSQTDAEPSNFQKNINSTYERRLLRYNPQKHLQKRSLTRLHYVCKYGNNVSFDRNKLLNAKAQIQLTMDILKRNDDGTAQQEGESKVLTERIMQRTKPVYIKEQIAGQRASLDVLLNHTAQTLELMEMNVKPTSALPSCLSKHPQKLSKRIRIEQASHRKRMVELKRHNLKNRRLKKALFADPSTFFDNFN